MFGKKDLKTGMTVRLRECNDTFASYRDNYVVLEIGSSKYIYNIGDWDNLKNYNEDLTHKKDENADIVRVYKSLCSEPEDTISDKDVNEYVDLDKIRKQDKEPKILLKRKGKNKVVAKLVIDNETVLQSTATCHKEDDFNFSKGCEIASERLIIKLCKRGVDAILKERGVEL